MLSKGHYLQPGRCLSIGSSNCKEQKPRGSKVGVTLCKAELSASAHTECPQERKGSLTKKWCFIRNELGVAVSALRRLNECELTAGQLVGQLRKVLGFLSRTLGRKLHILLRGVSQLCVKPFVFETAAVS